MKNRRLIALIFIAIFSTTTAAHSRPVENSNACLKINSFGFSDPSSEGFDINHLAALTRRIQTSNDPLLSLLISRNGRLVYELYTGGGTRDEAHYLMSVTKSAVSALVGAALHQGLMSTIDEPLTKILPAHYFPTPEQRDRMSRITLRHALTMSALDAQVAPHPKTPDSITRQRAFYNANDQFSFALSQKILPRPGEYFQYTDVTTSITGGVLQYLTGETLLEYSRKMIFDPLNFKNSDWMHQDRQGQETAAYGLRLRPIDMQKFGILYLNKGCWNGKRLIDETWIDESTRGWIRSHQNARVPNYGLGWWRIEVAGHTGYEANGWKGQRIMIFPNDKLVVTVTAVIEHNEGSFYPEILREYIFPSIDRQTPISAQPATKQELDALMKKVNAQPSRLPSNVESRMIPQISSKESHHPYRAKFQ